MRAAVARDTLAPVLARAAALVAERNTIPVLDCARLETGPDGLGVVTSNMETWYTASVAAEPDSPWSGCVNADRLRGFVHSLPAGSSVELTADDRALTIAGSGARARLAVLPSEDFPVFAELPADPPTVTLEAPALAAALRFVEPSVGADDARRHLTGVYLDPEGRVVSTDGHRLALCRFAAALPGCAGMILPLPSVRLLLALLKGFTDTLTLRVAPNLVTFAAGNWTLTSKLVDGSFPDWRRVLPPRSPTPVVVEHAPLRGAVARIANTLQATPSKTTAARLRLAGRELTLSAKSDATDAEVETAITIEAGPAAAEAALNARYLAEALAVVETDRVEIHLREPDDIVWVCAAGDAENGIVVVPMRG